MLQVVERKCIYTFFYSLSDQSSPAVVEEHAAHQLSRSPGDVPEQHLEVIIFCFICCLSLIH